MATNYVQNGGFETGDYTDWFISYDNATGPSITNNPPDVHSGTYASELTSGTDSPDNIIQQAITGLTSGTNYTLSFYFKSVDIPTTNFIQVNFNGMNITNQFDIVPNLPVYMQYSTTITYTGTIDPQLLFSIPDSATGFTESSAIYLDNISITANGTCFHGKSQILTKNILTGEIEHTDANLVLSNVHQVYSTTDNKFIPIIHNIVSGANTKFVLLKKDSLGINKPSNDFYITAGHPIVIDNVEIESQNIPQGQNVILDLTALYTICTEKREPISINGLDVLTWNKEDWLKSASENKLYWYDNKLATTDK